MPNIPVEGMPEKYRELYRYLRPGDFASGDLALVESCLGSDIAFALAAEMNGIQITIAKNALLPIKKRYVRENFDGSNQKQLAMKSGLSLSTVYSILKEDGEDCEKSAKGVSEREKGLFDFMENEGGTNATGK